MTKRRQRVCLDSITDDGGATESVCVLPLGHQGAHVDATGETEWRPLTEEEKREDMTRGPEGRKGGAGGSGG